MKRPSLVSAIICLVILALPAAFRLCGPAARDGYAQDAPLPAFRPLDPEARANFAADFEAFLADSPLRATVAGWNAGCNLKLFATAPSAEVLAGQNGMLFFAPTLPDYSGEGAPSPEAREVITAHLRDLAGRVEEAGGWLYVAIAPNKNKLYPENMPFSVARDPGAGSALWLREAARDMPLTWVDLETPLRAAKAQRPVYYKTDTHWNEWGAYVAAEAILSALGAGDMPPIEGVGTEDYSVGDLARKMGLGGALSDPSPHLQLAWDPVFIDADARVEQVQGSGEGTLVILRDSFGAGVAPYLADCYDRTTLRWETPFTVPAIEADVVLILAERDIPLYLIEPAQVVDDGELSEDDEDLAMLREMRDQFGEGD